jgi:hypothetical protein
MNSCRGFPNREALYVALQVGALLLGRDEGRTDSWGRLLGGGDGDGDGGNGGDGNGNRAGSSAACHIPDRDATAGAAATRTTIR